jgi:hypothetical protein
VAHSILIASYHILKNEVLATGRTPVPAINVGYGESR